MFGLELDIASGEELTSAAPAMAEARSRRIARCIASASEPLLAFTDVGVP
jgi:hypothetical protein